MAKTKSASERSSNATFGTYGGKSRPFSALFFLAVGAFLLFFLITFDLDQSLFNTSEGPEVDSIFGKIGEYIPFYLVWGFGISAWVMPFFCLLLGFMNLFRRSHLLRWSQILSLLVFTLSVSIFGTLAQEMYFQDKAGIDRIHNDWNFASGLGGTAGNLLYWNGLKVWLGPVGTSIVNGAVLLISLLAMSTAKPRGPARGKVRQRQTGLPKETRAMRIKPPKGAGNGEMKQWNPRKDVTGPEFGYTVTYPGEENPASPPRNSAGEETRRARKPD